MSRMQQDRIEELARLLDGDVTDRSSAEAQQLLVLANALRENAPEPARPTPAFRAQLRAQLVEEAAASQVGVLDRAREAVRERTARWRYSARVATASATASLMIGSAGAAVAAQSALPGELLYPLKQATESARLALANSPEEVGRVQLDLARERLEEITEGVDSLTASQVIDTLAAMDRHTEAGAEELLGAFDRTHVAALIEELTAFTDTQRSALTAVLDELPLEAVPFADRSFELLRRIDVQSGISAALCDCDIAASADRPAGSAGAVDRGVAAPGEGPAATACECAEADGEAPTRDRGLLPDAITGRAGADGDGSTGESEDTGDGEGSTVGSGISGPVGTLTEPVEDVAEPLEDLTEPITEPVEELTEPLEDLSEPVEDLTEAVDEVTEPVGGLTDPVDEVVDDVVDEVGDLLP